MSDQEHRDIRHALEARFADDLIQSRKMGKRDVAYLSGAAVISRLNHAAPEWSMRVVERWKEVLDVNRYNEQTRTMEVVARDCLCMMVEITIPGLGTRPGVGVQVLEPGAGEDVLKGALTDALKNAAKAFGVGLHLYGATEDDAGATVAMMGATGGTTPASAAGATGGSVPQGQGQAAQGRITEASERQHQMITGVGGRLGMDEADLDAFCRRVTGYALRGLSRRNASALIDALKVEEENGRGNPIASGTASAPTPGPAGTGGVTNATSATNATTDDVTVKRWLNTIEGARNPRQLDAMLPAIQDAGLGGDARIAAALDAADTRLSGGADQAF